MLDDCFAHDRDRLTFAQAIEILKSRMSPIVQVERVALELAGSRILAQTIVAPRPIPAFNNSAVDGYAYNHDDLATTGGFFPITARVSAGDVGQIELVSASAARIFTGAPMPDNADTVAMQEDCELHQQEGTNFVIIPQDLKKGANVRCAGEDVEEGETLLDAGCRLRPQDLAAIASCGISEIDVYARLKIALVSTGNEIIRPGKMLETGQIYDANFYMLNALLKELPVDVTDLGVLPDDRELVEATILETAKDYQVIITSGGASMGEEDHITRLLAERGKRHLWQLAVKPGRPMCFGQLSGSLLFGLPGNPVASYLCFLLYIYPSLQTLGGAKWHEPRRYKIPAGFNFENKKKERREFWRGRVELDGDGNQVLKKIKLDGSGLISSLRHADGFIEIDEDTTHVKQGEELDFIPFSEWRIL